MMKPNFYLLISLVLFSLNSFAQKKAFNEAKEAMSAGNETPIYASIPAITVDDAMELWEDYMDEREEEVLKYKQELFVDNAVIPSITDGTIDILTTFSVNEKSGGVRLAFLFDLGGSLLSAKEHSVQYKNAQKFIDAFSREASEEALNTAAKASGKELKDLEKSHERLLEENENLEQQISDNNKELKQLEQRIEQEKQRNKAIERQLKDL